MFFSQKKALSCAPIMSTTNRASPIQVRLLVFTRYPEPGHTKTRLIPRLGADGAATLHRRMVEHTLYHVKRCCEATPSIEVEIWFSGGTRASMEQWLGASWNYREQSDGDLGSRIMSACDRGPHRDEGIMVIGTDTPELTADILTKAFELLHEVPLVIGPASDGGYYLIAMSEFHPALFQGISWGSSTVLEETLRRAQRDTRSYHLLPTLRDIDRPDDLEHAYCCLRDLEARTVD